MEKEYPIRIYSLNELKKAYSCGQRFTFVFFDLFSKHGTINEGCFSQFFPSQFHDKKGEQYSDFYQYMISQKARLFNDYESFNEIIQSDSQKQIMTISHKIKNFDQKIWDDKSEKIIFQGNLYKFSQNQELKEFLFSFPLDTIFIDADPTDKNLGIQLESNNPKALDPFQWKGENKLGFQITKVRDHILTLASTKIKPIYETPKAYNLSYLRKSISDGNRYFYVYFYDNFLSQYYPTPFSDSDGKKYIGCIQYMMCQKAALFKDEEAYRKILKCKNQVEIQSIGRTIKNFNRDVWDEKSEATVFDGNFYKFSQNEQLKDYLLSFPSNTIFVEADPDDSIWGIRMKEDDPKAGDPLQWKGHNKLGFQITRVRDAILNQIRKQAKSSSRTEDRMRSEQSFRPKTESRSKNEGEIDKRESNKGEIKYKGELDKRESNKGEIKYKGEIDKRESNKGEIKYKGEFDKRESNKGQNKYKGESDDDDYDERIESNKALSNERENPKEISDDEAIITYAYEDRVSQILYPEQVSSIDLLSSGITKLPLDNCPNLVRLRASKCYYLQSVSISNMPNLKVVDLLDDQSLTDVSFTNCSQLDTLEVGYCQKLRQVTGIDSLKYLSAPRCLCLIKIKIPKSIAFLDLMDVPISDILPVIQNYKKLECLSFSKEGQLKLSEITSNKSLKIIQMKSTRIYCDSMKPKSNLKIIIFESQASLKNCLEGNVELLDDVYVTSYKETNQDLNDFTMFDKYSPDYQVYQKQLYGPWGIPEVDLNPTVSIKKPIISPPPQINQERAADSILGSIIGSAVFDMLGVGVEFLPAGIAKALLLGDMNITWSHPRINSNNGRFVRSTPTDDTSQSILILRSIVDVNTKPNLKSKTLEKVKNSEVKIDPCDFGLKLIDWIANGHKEHKHYGALDVGISTQKIAQNPLFKYNPIEASEQEWEKSGRKMAANGSVMRIASSGCFAFWQENVVLKIAKIYSQVTHYDSRCLFCSMSAALLISRYIQWNSGLIDEPNIDDTLNEVFGIINDAEMYEDEVNVYKDSLKDHRKEIASYMRCEHVEDLKLSEKNAIGYCLKAFGAGVWALKKCKSIEEGIVKVLREGGDADTNGAVVGALLGAKFGFKAIPDELIDLMFVGQWMFREIEPYMKLMGIKMPPSPYTK